MQPPNEMDDQYMVFKHHIHASPPVSHPIHPRNDIVAEEDLDMDAQLENVSPERGGSSLQLSLERQPPRAAQDISQKSVHIADSTPPSIQYRNPRLTDASESQNTKRRKAEDYTATSAPHVSSKLHTPSSHTKSKRTSSLGIDMLSHMWLGFQMHEALLIQRGKHTLMESRTDEEFIALGTPPTEVHEFRSIRRAFPRTSQILYPSERPDAVPGQHLHLTQLPRYEKISLTTGLTEGFHITIRFDGAYKQLSRREVKIACIERLKLMNIPLGMSYSNPVDIGINTVTRNWAGFIKIHLSNPKRDGLALLRGERAFVMTMGDGERVIGKVEKGFELITKARNMRLHLKGEVLRDHTSTDILRSIVRDSYYDGREIEILSLTKSDNDKDFAFLTLTTEEARADILNNGLTYHSERLTVSATKDKGMGNPSELRISTTLVANNLPQRESQSTITKSLKKLLGEDNVTDITFGYQHKQEDDRQSGWCHIQCLNAAVYTDWLHKSVYMFGRRVDFVPHKGSIDGSAPNSTAIRLAQAPVREAIAQKALAMNNHAAATPLVSEKFFTKAMKDLVETMDVKLTTITNHINHNTDTRVEASTEILKNHAANIHNILSAMASEFQQSNHRIHNIMQTIATTLPDPPIPTRLPHVPNKPMDDFNTAQLAPPGFNSSHFHNSPSSYHKDPNSLNE